MKVLILDIAQKEYYDLNDDVQEEFDFLFAEVRKGTELNSKFLKSLHYKNLYEFRVKANKSIYRAISLLKTDEFFVVLFFQKKTQKIPSNILKTALIRSKYI